MLSGGQKCRSEMSEHTHIPQQLGTSNEFGGLISIALL